MFCRFSVSFLPFFLPSFVSSFIVYLFVCSLILHSLVLTSHLFLLRTLVVSINARVAERSKAIVSGTILFEVAGSNPASCILGSVEYEKKTEIRKETQCNVVYKQQNGLLPWFFM